MSIFGSDSQIRDSHELRNRTNALLDLFRKNYLESKRDDFVSDATGNMTVCLSAYTNIFEGFLVMSARNHMPQEMADGFVKWATDQLEDLKIRLNGIYEKRDMR
jgi:hypothetical protein